MATRYLGVGIELVGSVCPSTNTRNGQGHCTSYPNTFHEATTNRHETCYGDCNAHGNANADPN